MRITTHNARRHTLGVIARPLIVLGLVLGTAAIATAHDFWIVPTAFDVTTGDTLELRGQTGIRFPQSVAAVAAERIAEARIIGASADERLTDFSAAGKSLLIRHRPSGSGQRVVAVALVPRVMRQSAAGFERYLRLEGAESVADRYARTGGLPKDSVAMRVTKTAKTLVEIGSGGSRAFSRTAGHRLELVPASDVAKVRAGTAVPFRVLFAGQPLAQAIVVAESAPFASPWDAAAPGTAATPAEESVRHQPYTTDAAGMVTVTLDVDGLWTVRAANAVPAAQGSGADWDVHFATLVFAAGTRPRESGASARGHGSPGDSAAVAAVVAGFHDALAAGDSLRALALLDPDVVILESGDQETLAEYRAHHLAADIAFARAVRSTSSPRRVTVRGDVAWATSTSATNGNFRGRPINSAGAELMVLSRDGAGWRIAAIHWSSHARRAP